jgi:hypothetical protein
MSLMVSLLAIVVVVSMWAGSLQLETNLIWGSSGQRYELFLGRGSVVVCRLEKYRHPLPFTVRVFEAETPEAIEAFKRNTSWWHGNNSSWERVGWTVTQRRRFAGFEKAEGTYWPPFIWQHPKMPFELIQIPFWFITAAAAAPGIIWIAVRLRCFAHASVDRSEGLTTRSTGAAGRAAT